MSSINQGIISLFDEPQNIIINPNNNINNHLSFFFSLPSNHTLSSPSSSSSSSLVSPPFLGYHSLSSFLQNNSSFVTHNHHHKDHNNLIMANLPRDPLVSSLSPSDQCDDRYGIITNLDHHSLISSQRPSPNPWAWSGEAGSLYNKKSNNGSEINDSHDGDCVGLMNDHYNQHDDDEHDAPPRRRHKHNTKTSTGVVSSNLNMKKVKTRRKVREPRFCFKTLSDVDVLDDGYRWRKYGQKVVKNTQHPRSYYRCTEEKCRVKKRVERLADDPRMVITTYEGRHLHSPSNHLLDDYSLSSSSSSSHHHHHHSPLSNFFC